MELANNKWKITLLFYLTLGVISAQENLILNPSLEKWEDRHPKYWEVISASPDIFIISLGMTIISEDQMPEQQVASGIPCGPPADSCMKFFVRDTIKIPGCCDSVHVNFNYNVCTKNGETYFAFDHFTAYPLQPECDSIWDYWDTLFIQNLFDSLDREMVRFDYKASLALEELILTGFIQSSGGAYACPDHFVESNFYSASCYQWCLESFPSFNLYKLYCGSKCCRRDRAFCENSEGDVEASEPTFVTVDDNCDNLPPLFTCQNPFGVCDKGCGAP